MRVSVIIPTYRGGQKVLDCVQSVLEQTRLPDELIVVDSSDDDSPALIRERFGDQVHLVHLAERTLPSDARNVGAREATGDVLAFLDDDCLADPNWLAELSKPYEDPAVVWVAGVVWPYDNEHPVAKVDFWVAFSNLITRVNAQVVLTRAMFNLAYRREAYLALGGLPENSLNSDRLFNTDFERKHSAPTVALNARVLHRNPTDFTRVRARHRRAGHSFVFGRHVDPTLPGAAFLRNAWALPTLPVVRFMLFWYRMFSLLPGEAVRLLPYSVMIFRVFYSWYAGVREAMQEAEGFDWRAQDWGTHDGGGKREEPSSSAAGQGAGREEG